LYKTYVRKLEDLASRLVILPYNKERWVSQDDGKKEEKVRLLIYEEVR